MRLRVSFLNVPATYIRATLLHGQHCEYLKALRFRQTSLSKRMHGRVRVSSW